MADNKDNQYGLILIALSVFFLISGLDLLQQSIFSKGLSSLLAYITVAIGSYLIAKTTK
ncbi:MAG: hypothetical protein PHX27_02020 [Candidatus ainarchaeum sp.]|nr:hypothetical protein [Candidatus ainarchaeum sp.]